MTKPDLLALPFDQYSRQMQVAAVIDTLRTKNESFRILDVGGYKGATKRVQAKDEVTIVDVFSVEEEGYIQGDGLHLPFADNSFDFVVSFDVLEHIPANKRRDFIIESARVAKRAVITAAPFGSRANQYAEAALNRQFQSLHGKEHPWLKEHVEYGLPTIGLPEKVMGELKLSTHVLPSNDTILWTLMQNAIFMTSKYSAAARPLENLNIAYNQRGPFDGNPELEENYRHITCGFYLQKDAEKIKQWRAGIAIGSSSALMRTELANKIAEFFVEVYADLAAHASRLEKNNSDKDNLIADLTRSNAQLVEEVEKFRHSVYGRARENAIKLRNKLH